MTEQQHPITPPPELVMQWVSLACEYEGNETWIDLATEAARWGADQELEACCEWVYNSEYCQPHAVLHLRAARRPKPLSLKEQALALLQPGEPRLFNSEMQDTIRRALEQLDD